MDFLCILTNIYREKKKTLQEYQIIFWHCSQKKKNRNNPVKALQYVLKEEKNQVKFLTIYCEEL